MLRGKRGLLILQIVLIGIFAFGYVQARTDNTIQNLNLFGQVLKNVEEKYVEEVDMAKLLHAATEGLLRPLDPYCQLLEADAEGKFPPANQGIYEVGGLILGGYNQVLGVYAGSEAEQRGIRSGDYIYKINDKVIRNLPLAEMADLIRNAAGDTLTLAIVPVGSRGSINYHFVPKDILKATSPKTVPHAFVTPDNIGYIQVAYLTDQTVAQVTAHLNEFKSKNITGLVLDLRDCPNGKIDDAVALANLFVPQGTQIAELSAESGQASTRYTTSKPAVWTQPVVVLTNKGTAGMAELTAAAIAELEKGVTVGMSTSGKTGYLEVLPLTATLKIELTTRQYLTAKGTSLMREVSKDDAGEEKEIRAAGLEPSVKVDEKPDKRLIRQLDAEQLVDTFVGDKPLLTAEVITDKIQDDLLTFLKKEEFEVEDELVQDLWDDLRLHLEKKSIAHHSGDDAALAFGLTTDPLYEEAKSLLDGVTTIAQLVERGREHRAAAENTETKK